MTITQNYHAIRTCIDRDVAALSNPHAQDQRLKSYQGHIAREFIQHRLLQQQFLDLTHYIVSYRMQCRSPLTHGGQPARKPGT